MAKRYNSTADLPWVSNLAKSPYSATKARPKYSELPRKHGIAVAWDYFGKGDELGRFPNLYRQEKKRD